MLRYSRKVRKSTKGIKIIFETMLHLPQNLRLVRLLSGKTQTEFGEEFGASKAMIVSYEKGKANPDELFISRVSRYAGVSEEILRGKKLGEDQVKLGKVEKVEKVSHETRDQGEAGPTPMQLMKIIIDTNENIRKDHSELIQLHKQIVATNAKLADSNNELAKKIPEPVTADAPAQSQQDVNAMRAAVLGLLFEVGTGKRYKSVQEAEAAYNKRLHDALGLGVSNGTQKNLDKRHSGKQS